MNLTIRIKTFATLSNIELYQLLRLRAAVFIVEQNCVYQDIDNKDFDALHVLGTMDQTLVAYTRIFDAGKYFDEASIGRVVVDPGFRKLQLGHEIVKASIKGIRDNYNTTAITISAQLYLKRFYETHGFVQHTAEYLEDGIPHIGMKKV